jgi:magnesium-transporting ATPase (P-type)
MTNIIVTRKAWIHTDEDGWVEVPFKSLKPGDVIRLTEPDDDSKLVEDENGRVDFKVLSEPEPWVNEDGITTLRFEYEAL